MNLLTVGLSHRSAPVRMLERVAVSTDDTPKLLHELISADAVSEAVLLSTCNRVEVSVMAETFHGGVDDVTAILARHAGAEVDELADHLYVYYAAAAVEHLFTVAAGLDSMVLGEAQILGQLRRAYSQADEAGTVGKALHELTQQALRVGKRVHAETNIDAAGASVVSEALLDAESVLGPLGGRRAVLVGAGSMGALAASHLTRAGIGEVTVVNRTPANGERLADSLRESGSTAQVVGLQQLSSTLAQADLVVSCTGAVGAVLTEQTVVEALQERGDSGPLLICDLGLPRDTEPAVSALPGVTVVDLEHLQSRLVEQPSGTAAERARDIVAEQLKTFLASQRSAEVTPTVTALRQHAAEVVDAELLRLGSRLPTLDDAELDVTVREEVTRTVHRVVDKLLHTPTVRVKELANSPAGPQYADALRELFQLPREAAAAVSVPSTPVSVSGAGNPGARASLAQLRSAAGSASATPKAETSATAGGGEPQ